MIPFASETVTLYNRRRTTGADGRQVETWVRHVLTGCSWVRTHERVRSDTEVGYTSSVTCRIPASDSYLPPDQWDALDDPSGKFTLAAGDVLVYGDVADEIGSELSAAELVKRYARRGSIVVRSARNNSLNGILPHYAAKGV